MPNIIYTSDVGLTMRKLIKELVKEGIDYTVEDNKISFDDYVIEVCEVLDLLNEEVSLVEERYKRMFSLLNTFSDELIRYTHISNYDIRYLNNMYPPFENKQSIKKNNRKVKSLINTKGFNNSNKRKY